MNDNTETKVEAPSSYRRVLAATSMLGGAAAINMLIGMVRSKVVALTIGPGGVGVMGAYMSITGIVTAVASMGLAVSGVRELAEALGSGDEERGKQCLKSFRMLSIVLATAGTLVLLLGAPMASRLTFNNSDHVWPIAWLSITVGITVMTAYSAAVLQGAGHVGKTAVLNIVASVLTTAVSIGCLLLWKRDGIVALLIGGTIVSWVSCLVMNRSIKLPVPTKDTRVSPEMVKHMLKVGAFVMMLGMMGLAASYVVRVVLLRGLGEREAGFYQSAASLSLMYATYILGAMGTDFLPRLSAVAEDRISLARLVNEQTHVALLLGLPGMIGTIIMAPVLVPIFYTKEFVEAVPLLQILCISVLGRFVSWPLSYLMIARKAVRGSAIGEAVQHLINIGVMLFCLPYFGVKAAGLAAIASYGCYTVVMYFLVKKEVGLVWDKGVKLTMLIAAIVLPVTMLVDWEVPSMWRWFINGAIGLATAFYCLHRLMSVTQATQAGIVRRVRTLAARVIWWRKPSN